MLKRMIQDNVSLVNDALFSSMMNYSIKNTAILAKKNPFGNSGNVLQVKANNLITLKNSIWKSYQLTDDVELTANNLDVGSTFQVGKDYYVYLADDGTVDGKFVISLNATFPSGFTAENSRKLGGFHYGHIRAVAEDYVPIDTAGNKFGASGTGWKTNVSVGIVPNSVWDLGNRPKCSPEGMAKVGNLWLDIYQSSAAEAISHEASASPYGSVTAGKLQSKYGQLPVTGTEKMNWYSFQELAARIGKRLPSYGEWIAGAFGNPGGQDAADDYGWTKATNTARARTGCRVDSSTGEYSAGAGIKPYAVSAFNLVDCVGNVYEWLDEFTYRDGGDEGWAWRDVLGADKGKAYLYNDAGLVAFIAGCNWNVGVIAGCRAVGAGDYPWSVNSGIGCRLACDGLS